MVVIDESKPNGMINNTDARDEKLKINSLPSPEQTPTKRPQNQPPEVTFDKFLESASILGSIMFYFFICDYDHYFPAAPRIYSRDLFIFLMLMLVLIGAFFTSRECPDKLLSREQTEEWKGIMQVMFVWYHYFRATETYNAIRVFIAAYVWMTGFGRYFWSSICSLYCSIPIYLKQNSFTNYLYCTYMHIYICT